MKHRTVTLQPADIESIHSAPFTLVEAPGLGRVIWPIVAFADYKFGTVPYANGGGGNAILAAIYAGDTDSLITTVIHPLFYLDVNGSGAGRQILESDFSVVMVSNPPTSGGATGWGGGNVFPKRDFAENQALVLTIVDPTADPVWTGGDGTLTITTMYRIIKLT